LNKIGVGITQKQKHVFEGILIQFHPTPFQLNSCCSSIKQWMQSVAWCVHVCLLHGLPKLWFMLLQLSFEVHVVSRSLSR